MAACHGTPRSPLDKRGQTLSSLSVSHTKYSDSNPEAQCHRKFESHKTVHPLRLFEAVVPAVIHRTGLRSDSAVVREATSPHTYRHFLFMLTRSLRTQIINMLSHFFIDYFLLVLLVLSIDTTVLLSGLF